MTWINTEIMRPLAGYQLFIPWEFPTHDKHRHKETKKCLEDLEDDLRGHDILKEGEQIYAFRFALSRAGYEISIVSNRMEPPESPYKEFPKFLLRKVQNTDGSSVWTPVPDGTP